MCYVYVPGSCSISKALGLKKTWSCDQVKEHLLRKQLGCHHLDLLMDVSFERMNSHYIEKGRATEREREREREREGKRGRELLCG